MKKKYFYILACSLLLNTFCVNYSNAATKADLAASQYNPSTDDERIFEPKKADDFTLDTIDKAQKKPTKNDEPINFEADNIEYDLKNDLIKATGNIKVTQGKKIIKADKAFFNKSKNYILLKGNVYYKNEYNQETYSEQIEVRDNFAHLIIENVSMIMTDNSIIQATNLEKKDNIDIAKSSGFTACYFDQYTSPFWSIVANKITYNSDTKIINVYSGILKIKQLPVFWIPYFNYSEPSKKRKAGFLIPGAGSVSELGLYLELPFFIPINDYTNLTLSFTAYTANYPMFYGNYEQYIKNGNININGSYARDNTKVNNWNIFSNFKKDLNDTFRISGNYNNTSSSDFLNIYDVNNYDNENMFLTQNLNLEGFFNAYNYLRLSLDSTDNLNTVNSVNEVNPKLLPQLEYLFIGPKTVLGKIDANFKVNDFYYEDYSNISEVFTNINDTFVKTTNFGNYTLGLNLQNTSYYNDFDSGKTDNSSYSDTQTGVGASIEAEYPIAVTTKNYTNIFSPTLELKTNKILNNYDENLPFTESSPSLDTFNLFDTNRSNNDFDYEDGLFFNYGVSWSLINERFNGKMFLGQSINLEDEDNSNYIFYLSTNPFSYLTISYQSSLNSKTLEFDSNNIYVNLANNFTGVSVDYTFSNNLNPEIYNTTVLEELKTRYFIQLSKSLMFYTETTFDLGSKYTNEFEDVNFKNNLKNLDIGITWQNDCFLIYTNITKDYYNNSDNHIVSNTSYHVRVIFKNLGGVGV